MKVFCEAEIPVVYEIYPKPQNLREGNMEFSYSGDFNVVFEDGVNAAARNYLAKVLASHGITASYSEAPVADKTNLILGISGAGGAADAYFENISYDASALTDYTDGYILSVSGRDEGTIAVLAQDASAAYFSLTTLDQMLATKPGVLSEVVIEDYADIPIRGFIEGYYGIPWGWDGRMNLVEWGATQKMNTYVYAPKDDPYHRAQWATLYPEEDCANITELRRSRTQITSICLDAASGRQYQFNQRSNCKGHCKARAIIHLGVRQFGVLFDDIDVSDARTAATQRPFIAASMTNS
ncbi:MAG: beta-N-acetylglucosaminidase domain-containing protein [Oscillospiraceae bacterium]